MNDKDMSRKRIIAVALGALAIAAGIAFGVYHLADYDRRVTTDDAQVEQYMSPVNVRVSGYISEIRFREHQHVCKGDTLLIIDDREFRIALAQAEAALLDARSGSDVTNSGAVTAESTADAYRSSIAEATFRKEKLEKDYARHLKLLEKKATTPVVVEQYKTDLDMAKARIETLRRQQSAALSNAQGASERKGNAEAATLCAQAAVDMARLNLSYTVVTAPCDGTLGRRDIEEGQLITAGHTITTLIPDGAKWVVANYKERQIEKISVGDAVEITVDALDGKTFTGIVSAISAATGAKYSAIPTDNSAGNFVKIQQRIPVRIDFTGLSDEDNARLATGMMCIVKLKR